MIYEEYKKKFIKEISNISYRYNVRDVFSDFCNVFAISLQNAVWFSEKREEEYKQIVSKYTPNEVENLVSLGVNVINAFADYLIVCQMKKIGEE